MVINTAWKHYISLSHYSTFLNKWPFHTFSFLYSSLLEIVPFLLSPLISVQVLQRTNWDFSKPPTHTFIHIHDFDSIVSFVFIEIFHSYPLQTLHFYTEVHSLLPSQEQNQKISLMNIQLPLYCLITPINIKKKCDIYFPTLKRNPLSTLTSTSTTKLLLLLL